MNAVYQWLSLANERSRLAAANHLVRELAGALAQFDAVVTLTKQAFTPSDQAEAITFCRVIGRPKQLAGYLV